MKSAVNFIGDFEATLTAEAARNEVDGVVCGHIHHPVIRDMAGLLYVNTGDWVDSCSAVVEDYEGRLQLIRWTGSERDAAVQARFLGQAAA